MKLYKVKKGDSSRNIKITVEGYPALDENWTCGMKVVGSLDDSAIPVIDRLVPKRADASAFDAHILPIETSFSGIVEGKNYYWQIIVANDTLTPAYHNTTIYELEIENKV